MGAMGVALGTMVANLSSHKRGWDDRWEEFSDWAEKGMQYQSELVRLVDEDTNAFNKIMDAFGLPKKSEEEKAIRKQAIQDATKNAIIIPFRVMEVAYKALEVINSSFNEASFFENELKNVVFDSVDFEKTIFYETKLKGADLSTCKIDSIKIDHKSIEGSIISSWQAESVCYLLGVKIK